MVYGDAMAYLGQILTTLSSGTSVIYPVITLGKKVHKPKKYGAIQRYDFPAAGSVDLRSSNYGSVRFPVWKYDNKLLAGTSINGVSSYGVLSFIVQQLGVTVPYALCRLYYKPNGYLIEQRIADVNGYVEFEGLIPGRNGLYHAVFYRDGYNALTVDDAIPDGYIYPGPQAYIPPE
jgi:hypothetical protein